MTKFVPAAEKDYNSNRRDHGGAAKKPTSAVDFDSAVPIHDFGNQAAQSRGADVIRAPAVGDIVAAVGPLVLAKPGLHVELKGGESLRVKSWPADSPMAIVELTPPYSFANQPFSAPKAQFRLREAGSATPQTDLWGGAARDINRAARDGIALEKWSPDIEALYRNGGRFNKAEAIRHCRLGGAPACTMILTQAEVQGYYDSFEANVPKQGDAAGDASGNPIAAGTPLAAGTVLGGPMTTPTPPFGGGPPPAYIPPSAPPGSPIGWEPPPPITSVPSATVPEVGAGTGASAGTGLSPAAVAAPPLILAAYIGLGLISLYRFIKFQERLIEMGYIIIDDPLQTCISNCHRYSKPSRGDLWRDFPDPITLRPLPRLTPWMGRIPFPEVQPIPDTGQEERRRRRRACPPLILYLPRAKSQDFDVYAGLTGMLMHVPGRPRDTNQRYRWHTIMQNRIPPAVFARAGMLGLTPEQVIFPHWSNRRVYASPMQVDHVIEMQVTPVGMEGAFDIMAWYRLMDASSNLGAGPELEANIRKIREAMWACTGDETWMQRLIIFEAVAESTSNFPGIWSSEDLVAGRHLDAYQRL